MRVPQTSGRWSRFALIPVAVALSAVVPAVLAREGEPPPTPARQAFERLKSLEGVWVGKSTKGWEERMTFKTIAAGSVVMETSFDAHPNETMVTMYHMDGERLILTHYCVAKNQPRLEATEFGTDGSVTFTFKDATNLPSRDAGHMDKCRMAFTEGSDRFTSQWTWYQAGKENWMEEIIYTRETKPADPTPSIPR